MICVIILVKISIKCMHSIPGLIAVDWAELSILNVSALFVARVQA